ncbi:MAG: undecaprenyl/decaprenyl-phosphate alpha-N-acetylglucosaminyl 1-phosphate transferase [Verrucomicrobia bacterium]|nr:undecaprenyl/decaprenyl-phosphate alpha-N-acetylglucosaminyl 1-phosphate transferase [Verrucomicrobiota bacterium]
MIFPLNVYLLALAGGLVASAGSLPLWRAWCRRIGHVDDPGHRKIHSEPVALAGGLAVFTGLALPVLMATAVVALGWLDPATQRAVAHGLARRGPQLAAVLGGCLGMVVLGWLDDRYELRAATKFGGQVLIALLVAASGVRITLFVPSAAFSIAVTVLWIVTLTNAFNFLDNMNGLCAGVGAIGAFAFGMKAAIGGQYLVAILAFLAFGALLGFLPYNYPRATAFLGDAGSHLVGFLLAVLAILPHFYSTDHPVRLAVLNPLLILAVPLVDLVWVVVIRWRLGKPFYVGDNNHLSHRLVRRGLSRTRAVLVIWLLAAGAAALAFA